MILKSLDSHDKDLNILNSFLNNDRIPKNIKTKIEFEIKKIRAGIKGEKETAYELDFKLKDSVNTMVIHNLRLEVDGKVAQIDHIVMSRLFEFYICESKNFSEGFSINEELEFTYFYNGKPQAIASPIEQNNKHIDVLKLIFDKDIVQLPKRLGIKIKPNYFNSILASKSARITRPKRELPPRVKVFKNDQFIDYFMDTDKKGGNGVVDIVKIVSPETIKQLGEKLVQLHKPIEFNWIEKFGLAQYLSNNENIKEKVNHSEIEFKTKEQGVENIQEIIKPIEKEPEIKENVKTIINEKKTKQYYCETCGCEINNSIVFWCRKNKEKLNNKLLCREHQS